MAASTTCLCRTHNWRARRIVQRLLRNQTFAINQRFTVRRCGLKWELNPADEVDADLFWFGEKEWGDFEVIRRFVKPGHVIFDVGANFGFYALTLAHELQQHCTVHAFEPNPATYQRLLRHITENKLACVHAHPVALGDHASQSNLICDNSNTGAAYLIDASTISHSTVSTVTVVPLDDYVKRLHLTRLDFVKVDIEGYDCFFLDGAKTTLTRFKPFIMIEISPEQLARNAHTVPMVLEQLRNCGYSQFEVCHQNKMIPFTTDSFAGGWRYRNVFCRA